MGRQGARSERINRSDVVAAARSRLEAGGLHALAMRRIADDLGVQQSALYWHFENKQALLAALADEILAGVATPDEPAWDRHVAALALGLRDQLLRYPDGAELVATAFAFRLGARRPFTRFAEALTDAGLAPDEAETAASVLLHFVLGFTTNEQQHRQAAELGAIDDEATDPHPVGRQFTRERFEHGVELILAGIRTRPGLDR
ncbi:MAG: TetR/AcrR family transcriptional regulator C-terminal domain-containing protein [Acidimicrobiales bacterium]